MTRTNSEKRNQLSTTLSGLALCALCCLGGCAVLSPEPDPETQQPQIYGAHYLEDGGTIVVENGFFENEGVNGVSLLEKLEQTNDSLKVQSEKNALLIQELTTVRDARDQLKTDLEDTRMQTIDLNERIAALKVDMADMESDLQDAFREKKDLLEQIINLKLEKTKIEKELLRIKIAALSGDG